MKQIIINPVDTATVLAESALLNQFKLKESELYELNDSGVEVFKKEYQDLFNSEYDYYFEMLTNSSLVSDSRTVLPKDYGMDFLSVCQKYAISSNGSLFKAGGFARNESEDDNVSHKILRFELDVEGNEIYAIRESDEAKCHISFLEPVTE